MLHSYNTVGLTGSLKIIDQKRKNTNMEICRVESSKLFYLWQKIVFSQKKRKVSLTKLYQHKNLFSHQYLAMQPVLVWFGHVLRHLLLRFMHQYKDEWCFIWGSHSIENVHMNSSPAAVFSEEHTVNRFDLNKHSCSQSGQWPSQNKRNTVSFFQKWICNDRTLNKLHVSPL